MPKPQYIQFQRWAPDQGTFGTTQSEEARGVIRTATGFRPFPGLAITNQEVLPGNPIPPGQDGSSRPTGMFFGRDAQGNAETYVAIFDPLLPTSPATSRIHQLGSDGKWAAATSWDINGYDRFRSMQWEDFLFATNFVDYLRVNSIGADNDFYTIPFETAAYIGRWDATVPYATGDEVRYRSSLALPATRDLLYRSLVDSNTGNIPPDNLDPPDPPWELVEDHDIKARYVVTIKDHVMIADCIDPAFTLNSVERGGEHRDRVRWSGNDAPLTFSLPGDPAVSSGFQDLPDAGGIKGLVGGEYGVVLCENGVFRVDYVGPPAIFSFNRIERARGCIEPNSVVAANDVVYYLSDDGWKTFDGQTVQSFGAERFDRWFRANATRSLLSTMTTLVDPNNQLIVWGFNATRDIVDVNDTILIYNYNLKEGTYQELNHSILGTFVTPAVTSETVTGILVVGLEETDAWVGRWSATAQYAQNDVAVYGPDEQVEGQSFSYRAIANPPTLGELPPDTPAEWELAPEVTAPVETLGNIPWDSTLFKESSQLFGGISRDWTPQTTDPPGDRIHLFSGYADLSIVDTPEFRMAPDRARLQRVQLAIEGDESQVEVLVGARNRLGIPVTWTPPKLIGPDGSFRFNIDSRYFRIRARISGVWRDATGVFVEQASTGKR